MESQIICPRERRLAMQADRLAEPARERQDIRGVVHKITSQPAEQNGEYKHDSHFYYYSLKHKRLFGRIIV
jgi:hypothetical protein